jgi:soluble lytic murein transglycosylase-like protein
MTFNSYSESLNKVLQRISSIDQQSFGVQKKEEASSPTNAGFDSTLNEASFASVLENSLKNLPPRANQWVVEDAVQQAGKKVNLDADLIKAVIQIESAGNSNAQSGAGAKGLMQLIDSTAAEMGVDQPFNPHQNVLGGAKYLKQQLQRFGGNLQLALAAYNAGPHNVVKYNSVPPFPETQNYVVNVINAYQKLKSSKA